MTNKELLYVEDALGHTKFLETSTKEASKNLLDVPFGNYMKDLEKTQNKLFTDFLNLL